MKLGLLGGNTKAKILDLRRECGTMLKLLDFAEYFVTSNIRREFVIGETGMYRKEIPEIQPRPSARRLPTRCATATTRPGQLSR